MTKKKEAKKPIWEIESDEEIEKDRESFSERIKGNYEVAMKLKEHGDHFKAKPNAIPTLPTMEEFLNISSLHKLDNDETLRMIQHLTEALIQIDKNLAAKLQYLDKAFLTFYYSERGKNVKDLRVMLPLFPEMRTQAFNSL